MCVLTFLINTQIRSFPRRHTTPLNWMVVDFICLTTFINHVNHRVCVCMYVRNNFFFENFSTKAYTHVLEYWIICWNVYKFFFLGVNPVNCYYYVTRYTFLFNMHIILIIVIIFFLSFVYVFLFVVCKSARLCVIHSSLLLFNES
jgi:hypothetical protein